MSQTQGVTVDNFSSAWGRYDLASTSSNGEDNSGSSDTGAQNSNDSGGEKAKGSTEEETADTILAEQQLAKLLDRRRCRRENMSRYRRKKKLTVEEMKIKEKLLTVQLHSILDLHASQSQTYNYVHQWDVINDDDDGEVIGHRSQHQLKRRPSSHQTQLEQEERGPPTAMDAFVNVLAVKERLRKENAALRRNVEDYHKFHRLLQETLDEEQEQQQDGASVYTGQLESQQRSKNTKQGQQEDHGRWIQFLPNEVPFYYVPLTEFETIAYVTRTLESVYTMQIAYLSGGYRGAHVVTLFDWTASLLLDFDEATQMPVIQYEFKKTFQNSPRTVDELVENEWEIMHSAMYQNLHRVPVKSKVLQRVNENLSVVMWNAPDPEQSLKYRNVSVFSKTAYQNPEGHDCQLVGLTGIPFKVPKDSSIPPPTSVTTVEGEPVVYVTSGFMYTIFSQNPEQWQQYQRQQQAGSVDTENEVHVAFGGYALIVNEEQGRFLMVELGSTCVRLEHLLFPFRVLR